MNGCALSGGYLGFLIIYIYSSYPGMAVAAKQRYLQQ